MVERLRRLPSAVRRWLLALLVGSAVFLWLGYARTLDPRDVEWIALEDPFAHVMGWEQHRNAPLLQYPITKNERYGLEWSSTIVYSDSIPIAALALRPLSPLLPRPFQYLGWWTLLALVLQAYWGARLVQLRSPRMLEAAIGGVFFAVSPVLLNRIGLHTALASHWLLLCALWLYLSSRSARPLAWLALLLLTVSVHAYLFVMVGAIWAAHLVSCRMRGVLARRELAFAGGTLVLVILWMHVLGYFVIGEGAAAWAGISRLDLTSFLAGGSFTTLMPEGPAINWDGNAFLGTGLLLLLVTTVAIRLWRRWHPGRAAEAAPTSVAAPWSPLIVVVGGLALFAITNEIVFAGETLVELPLPSFLQQLYLTFRGAARMIWPAYYLIVLCVLWLAIRSWPRRYAAIALALALITQLVDVREGVAFKAGQLTGAGLIRPLHDPIWSTIATHYQRLVSVPAFHGQPDHPTFAWFAAQHGLGSNLGYFGRTNPRLRRAGARIHLERLLHGTYDRSTVYYFPSSELWRIAAQGLSDDDLALVADGHHLLLPGGRRWAPDVPATPPAPTAVAPGRWIELGHGGTGRGFLMEGWSWQEDWGIWSADPEPSLVLPAPPGERVRVSFRWIATAPPGTAQRLRVRVDDQRFETQFAIGGTDRVDTFEVVAARRLLDVRIEVLSPVLAPDHRMLGVGLISARVQRAADASPEDDVPDAARAAPVLDTWIPYAAGAPGRELLQRDWSYGEAWGTWSADRDPTLALPAPPGELLEVSFRWLAAASSGPASKVRIYLDGRAFDVAFAEGGREQERSFQVTSERGWIAVKLAIERPELAQDGRMLGVGLIATRVRRVPPRPDPERATKDLR